ncbi:hypothetical protein MJD09_10635, partial [bacterium]|nr:hypothetical protein [bacterium]
THYPVERISFLQNGFRFSSFIVFLLPPLIVLVASSSVNRFLKVGERSSKRPWMKANLPKDFIVMMVWWLAPSAIFFTFIHYSKGYFLICAAAFFSLMLAFVLHRPRAKGSLGLAILCQTLIFIFMPYSAPDLQTYISPQMRTLNPAQIWWNRTSSVYLMAQTHIRALEGVSNLIETALQSPEATSQLKRSLVFLDPTFPLSIRSMQVKYPELQFMRLSYRERDRYETYSGLEESSGANLAEALANAVIISRADFVRLFLSEIPKQIYHSGDFVVFRIHAVESEKLTNSYTSYFLRT